jgi:SnoaL-like domain
MTMKKDAWVNQLFQSIDNQNAGAFVEFLSDNVLFQFGNAAPVRGKVAVGDAVHGFFGSIKALRHNVTETLEQPDTVICHGTVTYTRHDSSILSVPFANIFKLDADLIKEYLIYVDVSELYRNA